MSRSLRRWAVLPTALALAMTLASCNSGGDGESSSSGDDLTWEDSPLNKVFAGLDSYSEMSEEEMQARNDELNRKREEAIAQCMTDQGFEYQPQTISSGSYDSEFYESMDTLEWAQQYGYGASTGSEIPWPDQEEGEYVDPNQEILDAMSESERQAWEVALWGDMSAYEDGEDVSEIDWSTMGCSGQADQAVMEEDGDQAAIMAVYEDPRFTELFERMNALYGDDNSDMYEAVNQEWATCMADAGYPDFDSPEAAQQSIYDQIDALYNEANPDPEATEWVEPDLSSLKDEEIAVATADYTCKDETDYQNQMMQAQFDKEQEFIDENRDDIDALTAAIQEAQG